MAPGALRPGAISTPRSSGSRFGPHKIGISALVLVAISFMLPFASVSHSRIATGQSLHAWEVLDVLGMAALLAPWAVVLVGSLVRPRTRMSSVFRGGAAASSVLVWILVSGAAAGPAVERIGPFARYSLGAGVWLMGFAAFALIISARRELGLGTVLGWIVTLLGPVGIAIAAAIGTLDDLGILVEYHNLGRRFWPAVGEHIAYSASSIIVATILGVGLGVVAYRYRRASGPIFSVVSAFQTIPGLALIGILVAPMAALSFAFPALRRVGVGGLGWAPVVLALTLYALLAIVRNTYAGLASVPSETVEAGRGMGMTSSQVVRRVQMPLAAPVVFSGVRTASQQTVANATLGAFVAAGGLGPLVFFGLAQQANDLVLLGSIALVALALTVDGLMRGLQHLVTPKRTREHTR